LAGSYNHITLVGRLSKDPEIRYVASGSAVCSFSIAINRRSKSGDEVMFVDCVAWNSGTRNLADVCNNYLHKGMTVLVDGRLSIREYTAKDGGKRKATEIIVNDMQMLDKKDGGGSSEGYDGGERAYAPSRSGGASQYEREVDDEGEIPF
jgi:single-strand DNA-binding protein